jgi:hypothetical protein
MHFLEYFQQTDGRDDQGFHMLNDIGLEVGIGTVGEILEPAAGIDEVHTLSFSLATAVSIPLRKPRIFRMGLTGISSIRLS